MPDVKGKLKSILTAISKEEEYDINRLAQLLDENLKDDEIEEAKQIMKKWLKLH